MDDFKHLAVEFYTEAKPNKRKSELEGRPVFDNVEMVKIRAAGDPKTVFCAPANDVSSVREPESNRRLTYAELHFGPYEAFKKGEEYIGSGTPLSEVPFINVAREKELKALSIYTVEALATLEGPTLKRLGMDGRELMEKAKAYLDNAEGSADVVRLAGENEAMKKQIDDMKAQMERLMDQAGEKASNEPMVSSEPSPFQDWDVETITVWLEEQGAKKPPATANHSDLVKLADKHNEKMKDKAA